MKRERVLVLFAVGVLIISLGGLFKIFSEYVKNNESYNDIRKINSGEEGFKKLKEINEDFYGWINIPGSKVDYPLVHSKDNEDYLEKNFYNEENKGGGIFIDCYNKNPFNEKNTVIHGHAMRDGSMFGELKKYKNEEFFMENPYIYIKDEKGESKWEIFSVYVEEWNEEPYRKNFKTEKEWEEYIEGLREKSLYKSSGEIFGNIITLSTCSYEMEEGRLVIHGGKK